MFQFDKIKFVWNYFASGKLNYDLWFEFKKSKIVEVRKIKTKGKFSQKKN